MPFKFNPLTGELDLVNKSGSTGFDPTPTIDMTSTTIQKAIEELDQQFSPNLIPANKKITVKIHRTLVTPFLKIESNAQLIVLGRVVLI
jgi:hypothetical protein